MKGREMWEGGLGRGGVRTRWGGGREGKWVLASLRSDWQSQNVPAQSPLDTNGGVGGATQAAKACLLYACLLGVAPSVLLLLPLSLPPFTRPSKAQFALPAPPPSDGPVLGVRVCSV